MGTETVITPVATEAEMVDMRNEVNRQVAIDDMHNPENALRNRMEQADTPEHPEQVELIKLMQEDKTFVAIQNVMQVKNQISKIETIKDHAISRVKGMLPDDKISILEARAMNLDVDKVLALDMKKDEDWKIIKDIYTFEDGSMIHFTNEPDPKEVKAREMHRDYLVYLQRIRVETEKFDQYEKTVKAELDKLYAEMDEVLGETEANKVRNYASFADYYREWIIKTLAREDISDEIRNQLQKILDADNRGIELKFLRDEIERLIKRKGGTSSLMYGYRHNFQEMARKATAILLQKFSRYNYHLAFNKFFNIEERFFKDEIGEKYNNLFMFILFRFIKFNYDKFDNYWMITIGEIVTQLGFYSREASERPESNKEFTKNLRELLLLVINN